MSLRMKQETYDKVLQWCRDSTAATGRGMSAVSESFWGQRKSRQSLFVGGGCLVWLFLGFAVMIYYMTKISLYLLVECSLFAWYGVIGVVALVAWVCAPRKQPFAIESPYDSEFGVPPGAVVPVEGPRDWTPTS